MGGVPLLLMAIAMGITYGWHPDGAGGVNYIIQVPPEQLDAVRRSGEISSVIDPEVRGHVSRIIIRVGEGPLPRDTPADLRADRRLSSDVVQASVDDYSPIESPQLSARSQTPKIVMKPQTGDPNGMSLPPTLVDAAADAASRAGFPNSMADLSADLARRQRNEQRQNPAAAGASGGIDDLMRSALGNGNPQLATTTNGQPGGAGAAGNNRQTPPPFTSGGNAAPVARVRTGGPTTAPTNTRDSTWFQLNAKTGGASTDPINTRNPWPDNMVGPPDPRKTQAAANAMGDRQQPIGSTTNFAHVPGGISLPNNGTGSQGQALSMSESERAEYLRRLQQINQNGVNRNAGGIQQNTTPSTNYPNSLGQKTATGNVASNSSFQSSGQQFPDRSNIDRSNIDRSNIDRSNIGRSNLSMNAQDARRLQFDPRLSQAQIAQLPYGGWSFDQYGNPTDRDGRILDQNGRLVSQQQAYDLTVGRMNATATLQQPFPDPRAAVNQTQTGFAATGFDDRFERIAQQDSLPQYNRQQQRSVSPPTGLPPQTNTTSTMSPSDRTPPDYQSNGTPARDPRDDSVGEKRRTTLAAQPMFNGLLLMSIVANVYLIFWLKNLRHQFHDLVASKRAAASDIAA